MNEQSFDEAIYRIVRNGSNKHLNPLAFYFLRDALDAATLKYKKDCENRHFTGKELSEAIAEYALESFGHLAYHTLSRWGITKTEDFGLIVYTLINEGVFGKSAEDKQSDFDHVFDLKEKLFSPMFKNFNPLT
jgi:uncharacterized repeat protein (TIGR04138 family)